MTDQTGTRFAQWMARFTIGFTGLVIATIVGDALKRRKRT